ncbi:MAG: response regulator [Holophagales bacterium]|nr:response regulator [Holophagales bacterium]
MDVQMPEVDGFQATQENPVGPAPGHAAHLVAMTAHATMEERQRCLDSGMDDHVSKPIDPLSCLETVRRYLRPSVVSPLPASSRNPGRFRPRRGGRPPPGGRKPEALHIRCSESSSTGRGRPGTDRRGSRGRRHGRRQEARPHRERVASLGARGGLPEAAERWRRRSPRRFRAIGLAPLRAVVPDETSTASSPLSVRPRRTCPQGRHPLPPAASFDPELARKAVRQMLGHLSDFDPAAEECLEANRRSFDPPSTRLVHPLRRADRRVRLRQSAPSSRRRPGRRSAPRRGPALRAGGV